MMLVSMLQDLRSASNSKALYFQISEKLYILVDNSTGYTFRII
jgi:hypothetical protein